MCPGPAEGSAVDSRARRLDALRMERAALDPAQAEARCLAWLAARDAQEHAALLLSAGPPRDDARFSILARRPRITIEGRLGSAPGASAVSVRATHGEVLEEFDWSDLIGVCRRLERELDVGERAGPSAERPFERGWIGAFGYDLAWLFEYGLPRYLSPDGLLPDLWLGWYDDPLVVDRERGVVFGEASQIEDFVALELGAALPPPRITTANPAFHREEYEAAVERVREHCLQGDLFQADMSRRITLDIEGGAAALFARLVQASPAAFMAYVGLGDTRAIVSASPEEFVRMRGRDLRTRPIKGTRPRGQDEASDARLARELLRSAKDVAELTMIVDLMRNDLGRVAVPGSVRVASFPQALTLPQVHHLYGEVSAELAEGRDFWDLLEATFPPGSIVGAPKPRAIEILERVERSRRGIYTGAIGYVDPRASAQLNVAIRTAEFCDGRLRFGVGGGVTALSDPAEEFEETRDKARGLAHALGLENLL